jgi:hypothetical protein
MEIMSQTISGETSAHALAAQVTATVQARYIMAMKRPRDWDKVRERILSHCKRPSFARKAMWEKDVGRGKIKDDLNIRFAEACMQAMGNLLPQAFVVFDDNDKRIVRIALTDLESNLTYEKDIVVAKKTERRKVFKDQEVLETRLNSTGDQIFIVKASNDQVYKDENAIGSKMLRNHALRLLPVDIQDEARDTIRQTLEKEAGANLEEARHGALKAFESVGVTKEQIEDFLGHSLIDLTASEAARLRMLYTAIKDDETTFEDALEGVKLGRGEKPTASKDVKKGAVSLDDLSAADASTHQDHDESAAAIAESAKKAAAKKPASKKAAAAVTKEAPATKPVEKPAEKPAAAKKTQEALLDEVMKKHGVGEANIAVVMKGAFPNAGDALLETAPQVLDSYITKEIEAMNAQVEARTKAAVAAEAAKAAEPEPKATTVSISSTTPGTAPDLPEGASWAAGVRASFNASRVDGKDLPFDQRKTLISKVCGADVLTPKGGLDARKIEWKHYHALRVELHNLAYLDGSVAVETDDGLAIPGILGDVSNDQDDEVGLE